MAKKEEEIKVGVAVILAAILFVTTLVFVGGVNLFHKRKVTYITYFKFAGGLEQGSFVRFGGLKVGTVQKAEIDPSDSTRVRIELQVSPETPVRANSRARISTLGFLGDNYVELSPGTRDAERLKPGSEIPADEIVQLADVFNNVNNVTLNASKLVNDLDEKFLALSDNANRLISNFNAVVRQENRQHFDAILSNADSMLAESRPRVKATLANLEAASAKLTPTVETAHTTLTHADSLVGNLNGVVQENRAQIHDVILRLQESLRDIRRLVANIDDALLTNRANLDETMENVRSASQNLKQFTDTLKQRPYSLIRVKAEKEHVPPTGGK